MLLSLCCVMLCCNVGRCINAVYSRWCNAALVSGVAKWIELSVTVRVTCRARARARERNPFLHFYHLC